MKLLRPCKFSEKYLDTYQSDSLRKLASEKRGIGKMADKRGLVVIYWNGKNTPFYYKENSIEFLD